MLWMKEEKEEKTGLMRKVEGNLGQDEKGTVNIIISRQSQDRLVLLHLGAIHLIDFHQVLPLQQDLRFFKNPLQNHFRNNFRVRAIRNSEDDYSGSLSIMTRQKERKFSKTNNGMNCDVY